VRDVMLWLLVPHFVGFEGCFCKTEKLDNADGMARWC
jgi:hypothetical protein